MVGALDLIQRHGPVPAEVREDEGEREGRRGGRKREERVAGGASTGVGMCWQGWAGPGGWLRLRGFKWGTVGSQGGGLAQPWRWCCGAPPRATSSSTLRASPPPTRCRPKGISSSPPRCRGPASRSGPSWGPAPSAAPPAPRSAPGASACILVRPHPPPSSPSLFLGMTWLCAS